MEPSTQPTPQIVRLTGVTPKGRTAVEMYGERWRIVQGAQRTVPLDPGAPDELSTVQCLRAVESGHELWVKWPTDPNVTITPEAAEAVVEGASLFSSSMKGDLWHSHEATVTRSTPGWKRLSSSPP